MGDYDKTISFWDTIFSGDEPATQPYEKKLPEGLQESIDWLVQGSDSILDYGCGCGSLLLRCAAYQNVARCLGIDLSPKAIELAGRSAENIGLKHKAEFICGGLDGLRQIEANSFNAALLSNIIDNVTVEDTDAILANIRRILKPRGKILVKLNPFLRQNLLDGYGLRPLGDSLYLEKEGIYLRNLLTEQWEQLIGKYLCIESYKEIYFAEYEQTNRVFHLLNNK